MQYLPLLASAATALAAAVPHDATSNTGLPAGYSWPVENWNSGCARSGCSYDFNVTGIKDNIYPGFKAYCSGYDTGYYKPCDLLNGTSTSGIPFVAASLRPNFQNGIATVSVSLSFTDADSTITYNVSGWADATYNAFVAPPQAFNITPTQVIQVL